MKTSTIAPAVAGALLFASAAACAMGGHFDVDDAGLLDPGQCQLEGWFVRAPATGASVVHLGSACRVGPVEAALNLERSGPADARRNTLGPQLKWAAALPGAAAVSAGIVAALACDTAHGGTPARALYLPISWAATEAFALHMNLGADWGAANARTRRLGAAAEWAASERWSVLAERSRIGGGWSTRIGTRFAPHPALAIDLSVARAGPLGTRVYGIGLSHDFAR